MKSLINSKTGAMLLVLMALSGTTAWADVDDFVLSVRDVTQPTANTIEFNLWLLDTDSTQTFEFAALQMGLLVNSSIYGTGTLTVSYSNNGSGLDAAQQFAGSIDVVSPLTGYDGKTLIRLMANLIPPVPPGAGTGTLIGTSGNGTFLAHFTITSSVSFTPNSAAGLEFCSGTAVSPLWPTVLYAYIEGNSNSLPVISGVDAIVDGDPLLNPRLPAVYDLTGGEPYCAGLGGSLTGLNGSESDATYTVYRNGFPAGTINGTGSALSFGLQPASTLTVRATNIAGTVQMNGELVITEIPLNTVSLTSGAGSNNQSVCISTAMTDITFSTTGATGIGTPLNLPAGVEALWAADVITISGTPAATGTFSYIIPLTGGCGTVAATGTITVNDLPTITVSTSPFCSADLLTYTLEVTVSSGTVTSSAGTVTDLGGNLWRISGVTAGTGVTVTVTDANTCANSLSVTSPDCSCPVVAAPVSGGNQSYCAGESIPSLTVTVGPGETADWYSEATGGTLLLAGHTTYTPSVPGTYYAEARVTDNNCVSSTRTSVTLTENPLPGSAGIISGPASFTPGTSGITYSVSPIAAATSYIWSYTGTGVTINGSGNSVTLDFSLSATPGTLSVFGRNSCGDGSAATLQLTSSTKTLTLTSVLLEGLYNGSGTMREVSNGFTSQFPGIADRIIVELHQSGSYSSIVYSVPNVELSLNGTATLTIPAEYSGNYYITVRHRNSIETTTSSPVSFAGISISQSFALTANVFGGNLKPSGDGHYLIYGADVNQDGIVDTGDMNDVDNGSASIMIGYNVPDANGDGLVDTSDMNMVDNNSAAIVYSRIPF